MFKKLTKDFKSLYLPLILSIIISYIFYLLSIKDRIPVFNVEPLRTQIIDAKSVATAPIQVIGPDNIQIKSDLSAITFHLWNRGGEAIESSDVLKPLLITLSDTSARFLDAKIKKLSRPDITKIGVSISEDKKSIRIIFNILDENDGFTCQTIFAGNPSSEVIIVGAIKGVKNFDLAGVSTLQYLSIVLALCALATIAVLSIAKLVTWYTYITYRDYYIEGFFDTLRNEQKEKLIRYFAPDARDSEALKNLSELYFTDKDTFEKAKNHYLDELHEKNKKYFYNTPLYESAFWLIFKNMIFILIYILISVSIWDKMSSSPQLLNPVNKFSYYNMIKNIAFPQKQELSSNTGASLTK